MYLFSERNEKTPTPSMSLLHANTIVIRPSKETITSGNQRETDEDPHFFSHSHPPLLSHPVR